mgnify:CR=1 FL=1
MAGKNLLFRRDHQVIEVDQPIQQQEELTLTINYEGKISENICYTDVLTEVPWILKSRRYSGVSVNVMMAE